MVCRGGPVNVNLDAATAARYPGLLHPGAQRRCHSRVHDRAAAGGDAAASRGAQGSHRAASGAVTSTRIPRPGRSWKERRPDLSVSARLAAGWPACCGRSRHEVLVADPYVDPAEVEAVGATAVAFGDLLPQCRDTEPARPADAGDPPPDRPRRDRPPPATAP